jgi:hypothetical protein
MDDLAYNKTAGQGHKNDVQAEAEADIKMTFTNIREGHEFNCIEECTEDTSSIFARRIDKDKLKLKDFRTYWESGKRPPGTPTKDSICGYKGISISRYQTSSERSAVMANFMQQVALSPAYRKFLAEIQFKPGCGMTKHTPTTNDASHHDFYKCDSFDVNNVTCINVTPL